MQVYSKRDFHQRPWPQLYGMINWGQNSKKLKGNDNTEDEWVEAGNTWDLQNATEKAYKQNKH